MPKGQYIRTKRGSYNINQVDVADRFTKRVLYLINKQYWTLQQEAVKRNMSISELIRNIMDNYIQENNIDVVTEKPNL